MTLAKRATALEEIRRRGQAAPEMREKIRWRVIEKIVETDLAFDHAGEIVDETGDAWCYLFPVPGGLPELSGDGLPLVHVARKRGRADFIKAYHEAINQTLVLDEEHKQLCLDRIVEAVGFGDGQQFGI